MKNLKSFEKFKYKNFSLEDIRNCIKSKGFIWATIVKDLPQNDPESPINPVSVDDDGLITVEIDGLEYEVDIENVDKIEF